MIPVGGPPSSAGTESGRTVTVRVAPWRTRENSIFFPGDCCTCDVISYHVRTVSPPTVTTLSPASMPARAAGMPPTTLPITGAR